MKREAQTNLTTLYRPSYPTREEDSRESALVAGLRTGDNAAYEELLRRYERQIFGLAVRMTRNEAGPTGRPFDLHDVDRVLVFGHRPTGPIVFEVDNVRLTLAPRTGFDLPSDDP